MADDVTLKALLARVRREKQAHSSLDREWAAVNDLCDAIERVAAQGARTEALALATAKETLSHRLDVSARRNIETAARAVEAARGEPGETGELRHPEHAGERGAGAPSPVPSAVPSREDFVAMLHRLDAGAPGAFEALAATYDGLVARVAQEADLFDALWLAGLRAAVLAWWEVHQWDEGADERNVYEEPPEFVARALAAEGGEGP